MTSPTNETDLDLAPRIADAAYTVEGVSSVGSGRLDQLATYLPNRTVAGVQFDDEVVHVEIVARYPPSVPLTQIASCVRDVVRPLAGTRRIDVIVADLLLPETAS